MYFFLPALLLFFLFFPLFSSSTAIRLGLFHGQVITSVQVFVLTGKCMVNAGKSFYREINKPDQVTINMADNMLLININGEKFFSDNLSVEPEGNNATMKVIPIATGGTPREVNGILKVSHYREKLILVNIVDLENYVAAVVDAEAGRLRSIEYYKAQAILCRTYTLSHLDRHYADDFDLCDATHCQKFNGVTNYSDVIKATDAVKSMVLVDYNYDLIISAYHSNCGGMTANSRYAWTEQVYYLAQMTDTFCLYQKHARWQVSVSEIEWRRYLSRTFKDTAYLWLPDSSLDYCSAVRNGWYWTKSDSITFTRLRADWKLNSPFFDISFKTGKVILDGRGYGHGVGMCQEGAMRMASLGYSYTEIIKHYFTGVYLMDVNTLNYFLIN